MENLIILHRYHASGKAEMRLYPGTPPVPTVTSTLSPDTLDDLVKFSFFSEIGTAIASATTLEETLGAVMKQISRVFAPEH